MKNRLSVFITYSLKNKLSKIIPDSLKQVLLKMYYFAIDNVERVMGLESMIPKKSIRSLVGNGNYLKVGQEFKDYFIELANLQPDYRVLDVGCGTGRMAIPLTNYLSQEGEYWGFDIIKIGVEWCQSKISQNFSNFHFLYSDVYNKRYNQNGMVQAQDYRFPFEDNFFDFIFVISVFTHMLPTDTDNYLKEISRVLKNGSNCIITFFIINEESEYLVQSGYSTINFKFKIQGCLTIDNNRPEDAIAYNEEFVKRMFEKYDLKIIYPMHYGSWCKRNKYLSYQDIIIATKKTKG